MAHTFRTTLARSFILPQHLHEGLNAGMSASHDGDAKTRADEARRLIKRAEELYEEANELVRQAEELLPNGETPPARKPSALDGGK